MDRFRESLKKHSVLWFALLSVLLSFAAYLIPLPADSRSVLVPVILVFVPTAVCIPLAAFIEGKDGLHQLFSDAYSGWKWPVIGALVGAGMRLAVLILGIVLGISIYADLSAPGTWFIILATIPLAYFEELGWRRFALDRMLASRSSIESSLLLGLPWGLIHLVVVLPGIMNAGAPAVPQFLILICMSIIITWAYVRSGGSVLTVTLLHGVQNGLVVLNRGLTLSESTWLMMWAYLILATLFVVIDRSMFFARPTASQQTLMGEGVPQKAPPL